MSLFVAETLYDVITFNLSSLSDIYGSSFNFIFN